MISFHQGSTAPVKSAVTKRTALERSTVSVKSAALEKSAVTEKKTALEMRSTAPKESAALEIRTALD